MDGLRGLVYFRIGLRGRRMDLHSGLFGGAVANPAFVLAHLCLTTRPLRAVL